MSDGNAFLSLFCINYVQELNDLTLLSIMIYVWCLCLFLSLFPSLEVLGGVWHVSWFICVGNFYEQHKFVFWYTRRTPGVRNQTSYEDNIKKIVDFSTVRSLLYWGLLVNINPSFNVNLLSLTIVHINRLKDFGFATAILLDLLLCLVQQICTFLRKESDLYGR